MPELSHVNADAPLATIAKELDASGGVIVDDFLSPDVVAHVSVRRECRCSVTLSG